MNWRILHGDVRDKLHELPDQSVQCCVTSPPYWGLRDYGVHGQLGLEPTPDAYVQNLVAVFRDVRRVLADYGTLWLNLGDSYNAYNTNRGPSRSISANVEQAIPRVVGGAACTNRQSVGDDCADASDAWRDCDRLARGQRVHALESRLGDAALKAKDLIGVPWRVAFALQADGWYLRSDIIWSKPNPMPESVTDRPTKAHEYIFLLSKSARYYYDAVSIREPYSPSTLREFADGYDGQARKDYAGTGAQNASDVKRRIVEKQRRHGSTLQGGDYGRHFLGEAIPEKERRNDKQRGHGRRHAGFNDRWDAMPKDEQQMGGANKRSVWHVATAPYPDAHFATYPPALIEPCILAGSKPGDTVLDPFCGSGTTGEVAIKQGRHFIGIELNAAYIELARKRINAVAPLFAHEEPA